MVATYRERALALIIGGSSICELQDGSTIKRLQQWKNICRIVYWMLASRKKRLRSKELSFANWIQDSDLNLWHSLWQSLFMWKKRTLCRQLALAFQNDIFSVEKELDNSKRHGQANLVNAVLVVYARALNSNRRGETVVHRENARKKNLPSFWGMFGETRISLMNCRNIPKWCFALLEI